MKWDNYKFQLMLEIAEVIEEKKYQTKLLRCKFILPEGSCDKSELKIAQRQIERII